MDFLDPRKKRAHRNRLIVGYVLLSIAIGLGTIILVYGAYGYSLNTKTGDIIQNGLLFVDSQPSGSNFSLNGRIQNGKTSARLVLPAGRYKLKISKDGYRDWQRDFVLEEHQIARYVYPFLFPTKPVSSPLKNYPQNPGLMTNSPDKHWLVVLSSVSPSGETVFDEYDTTNLAAAPVAISLPLGIVSATASGGTFKAVEWSSDNNNILLRHEGGGSVEFILIDRKDPSKSVNLNKLFKLSPAQVALKDKKIDLLYLYNQANKTLQVGKLSDGTVDQPMLENVVAFKSYGSDLMMYITDAKQPVGQVQTRIWDNGTSYKLSEMIAGSIYLIDVAKFQGQFYYVAGTNTSDRISVYKNPLDGLTNPSLAKANPFITLHQNSASKVSFSDNARFIAAEAGQSFVVYDLEAAQYYHYSATQPLAQDLLWMDGHRLTGTSNGSVYVMDYDGTNPQLLTPSLWLAGGLFDRAYQHMFTLEPSASVAGATTLKNVDLRAGSDLPKN